MTPGQVLLLQQIQLVAAVRRWDVLKTIKKTRDLMNYLEKAIKNAEQPKPSAPPSAAEAKLIAQAEQIIKDLFKPPPSS